MSGSDQTPPTRLRLLGTAEELFASHGITAVSNRQICEVAGQGNNYAVGYHFGSRDGLLKSLLRWRNEPIERIRSRLVEELADDEDPRGWLRCLVLPQLEFLGQSDGPTHFGVFCAQMAADPSTSGLLLEAAAESPTLLRILDGLYSSIPVLPPDAARVRTS